jgi:hypothetical protein
MAIQSGKTLVAILLALTFLNAMDLCKAIAPEVHSCCPASQQAPDQCAKLGCFMSAPMLRANVQSSQPWAWVAGRSVAPVRHSVLIRLAGAEALDPVFDRSISFQPLLI